MTARTRRKVAVERDLLAHHAPWAEHNRERFGRERRLALNLLSSPGAGKTTLLVETLRRLAGRGIHAQVVEGDQATGYDAERIARAGAPVVQVVTGTGCHLEAKMVAQALDRLPPCPADGPKVLWVENVGNLVCPAAFDLGEGARVVLASLTEGEDKPLKYPGIFATADLVVITKIDLAPHLDVDAERLEDNVLRVRPGADVLGVSARSGEGMDAWLEWIETRSRALLASPPG